MRPRLTESFYRLFATLLITSLVLGAFPIQAAASSEEFIQKTIEQAHAIANDRSLDEGLRNRNLRTLLGSAVDVRRIALFSIGRYTRLAPEGDVNEFVKVFEDYLLALVRHNLIEYRDNPIRVRGSTERAGGDVVVNAEVAPVSGENGSIKLGFRVRKLSGDNYVISDLEVEGLSLAIMGRVAFYLYLITNQEELARLSEELVRRTARIEADEMRAATSARWPVGITQ